MIEDKFKDILQALTNGGSIDYCPIDGGIVMFESTNIAKPLSTSDFLELREKGLIKHVRTMRQGHIIFHGRVDIYKIA